MGYLGLRGAECLMKTPKGLLSHGFTSFSPPWQGRYEWQRMLVRAIGKALSGHGGPGIGVAAARSGSLVVTCFLQSGPASRKFLSFEL